MSTVAPEPLVAADGVSKWFGPLVAVSDVSFAIGPGVTALLGPNGAGKSTMLRMLCGLAHPSRGTVRVLGRNPRTDVDVTSLIGLVPQQENVFESLTAHEFVALTATLHGLADARDAATRALETVGLDPADARQLPTYSKGMRQRVKVAQALVHDPTVLMLDEPLTGLDPRQRADMIALFRRLGAEGRCVIVSSHVLDEVRAPRLRGARHVAGPARRRGRLPRAAGPHGRPAAARPRAHGPAARARGRRCSSGERPSAPVSTATRSSSTRRTPVSSRAPSPRSPASAGPGSSR